MYDRETVEELNKLSKEVFGSSSKWRKMIDKGVAVPIMEDTKRIDPITNEVIEIVKTPVMHVGANGGEIARSEIIHYTVETIKEYMLNFKVKREELMAAIRKQQEEEKTKKAKADLDTLSKITGSALT